MNQFKKALVAIGVVAIFMLITNMFPSTGKYTGYSTIGYNTSKHNLKRTVLKRTNRYR